MDNVQLSLTAAPRRMRNRQRVLRNMIAAVGLGKAAVIGSGMSLALLGYVDLAQQVLPGDLIRLVLDGIPPEAAAGVGGLLGVVVGLIVSLFR